MSSKAPRVTKDSRTLLDRPEDRRDQVLGFVAILLVVGGVVLLGLVYENLPFRIPFVGLIARELLLPIIAVVVILALGAAFPGKTYPYPANAFTPKEWIELLQKARPVRQKDLLRRTDHQSLGLQKAEFLELLTACREHIWRRALGVYRERSDQLEQELRKEQELCKEQEAQPPARL